MGLHATTSQTVGPYYSIGLSWLHGNEVAGENVEGERIAVAGRVLDGEGNPVDDAFLEIWQANTQGKYRHPDDTQDKPMEPGFRGFARVPADDQGRFWFTTIKPGRVPAPGGGEQAPHLVVGVFMRGVLRHLLTRMYFPHETSNASDPVLQTVPAERRATLVARQPNGGYEWNVVLQGPDETVFFDY
jgi:protocatechuate 3,4-dioxygenase alpha subunit